nr:anthranilate phosphoribosyltransferase [Kineosphaera limosa]
MLGGADLAPHEATWAMERIMSGEASAAQIAGFLVALRAKGETSAEILAVADVMLAHANRIEVPGPAIDIVGTGGDRANTVNISTMAALVVAAAGVRVVKHGNRAASSRSGTADCLEALGVDLSLEPEQVAAVAEPAGITFCFAQKFHPSMRYAGPVRAELGVPTVFNVLGPLTNPAQPEFAAVGVADARMAPLVAGVFASRGKRTAVFRGDDGLDELTLTTTSALWWVDEGRIVRLTVDPTRVGLENAPLETLRGGDAEHNAAVVRQVFDGVRGPIRDAVLLNAGMALAVADGQRISDQESLDAALQRGIDAAAAAIDSGKATQTLEQWSRITQQAGRG